MRFHGKEYPGKHEKIISQKLYDDCQKVMEMKQHPKKKQPYFPFRGLMTCAKCGCLLTASRKKKKYVYYYCTNAKGNCSEHKHYLKEDEAIKVLSEVFDRLVINEEEVERMHENTKELFINNNPARHEYLEAKQGLGNELRRYKNRKDELFNLLLDKTITKEAYEEREKVILNEVNNFTEALKKLENEQEVVLTEKDLELTKNFFLSPKKQKKAFLKVSLDDKRKMLSGLLWNLSIDNKKLAKVSFKEPFETLANCCANDDIDNLRRVRDYRARPPPEMRRSSLVRGWRPKLPRSFVRRSSARFGFRLNSRLAANLFESLFPSENKNTHLGVFIFCAESEGRYQNWNL